MAKRFLATICTLWAILLSSQSTFSQSWDYINDPAVSPAAHMSDFAIHPITGEKYVAATPGGSMKVWKFSSGQWVNVGGEISEFPTYYPSLEFAPDGTLYVAYPDGYDFDFRKPTVKKFDGENWVTVGSAKFSVGRAGLIDMKISANGTLYVVYNDFALSNKVVVKYFNGAEWLPVGSPSGIGEGTCYMCPRIALDANGNPYVIYSNIDASQTKILKYNGTSWISLTDAPGRMLSYTLLFDNETLLLVGKVVSGKSAAYKLNGSIWTAVGTNGAGFSPGNVNLVSADIYAGTVYAVYQDETVGNKLSVQKYNGTNWEPVGSPGIALASSSWFIVLKIDAAGNPFLNFADSGQTHVIGFSCLPPEPVNTTGAADMFVCPGYPATLSASTLDGNNLKWYASMVSDDVLATGATYETPNMTADGAFYVSASNACGTSDRTAIAVTLHTIPSVQVTPWSATICKGEVLQIAASGATTYAWTNGPQTAEYSVSPASTTSYTVVGGLSNGCTASKTITVSVKERPALFIAGGTAICAGETTTLIAEGASAYQWSTGATTSSIDLTLYETTTLSLTGTTNGCAKVEEVTVMVKPLPVITFKGDSKLCTGETTTVTAEGADTYLWSTGARSSSIEISPTSSTLLKIRGVSSLGCSSVAEVEVTVNPFPVISISGDSILCEGQSGTLTAQGAASFLWQHGPSSAQVVVQPEETSTFVVTGTSSEGCQTVRSFKVKVHSTPEIVLENAALRANNITGGTLLWYDCDAGENLTGETSDKFVPKASGTFAVTVTRDACASMSDCFEYLVTDLADTGGEHFSVSPNPSKGIIQIHGNSQGQYTIINDLGQTIWSSAAIADGQPILLPEPGTYHILFIPGHDHRMQTRRLVIIH